MSIDNINAKQQPLLTTSLAITRHDTTKSLSEWLTERLYMLGLQGMLVLRERRH